MLISYFFQVTECIVVDPKSGNQYDLSKLSRAQGWETDGRSINQRKSWGFYRYLINVCRPLQVTPMCGSVSTAACEIEILHRRTTPVETTTNKISLGKISVGRANI